MANREEMRSLFYQYATESDVHRDEVTVIAKSNLAIAAQAFLSILTDSTGGCPMTRQEASKVLDLMWELYGASRCINVYFTQFDIHFVRPFLLRKLGRHPFDFNDADLNSLAISVTGKYQSAVNRARLSRVRGEAQRLLSNPRELTGDVNRVKQRVSDYGFSPTLNELLNKVESELGTGDGFDQAATLKHLRTFFEQLHAEAAKKLHEKLPGEKDGTDLTKCQQVIDYLQRKDVLSEKGKNLGRAIYGVLSDEGVHALQSTREYVRLCRNMVAEYGLILFYELERRIEAG